MEGVHGAAGTAKSTARLVFTKALAAAALRCASAARGPGIRGHACTRPRRSARARAQRYRDRVALGRVARARAGGQQGDLDRARPEPRLPRAPGRVEAELPTIALTMQLRSLFELEEA